jgi:hypothetical protein
MRLLRLLLLVAGFSLPAVHADALTLYLSSASSDATPASTLDATFDFSVVGGDTLLLTVTNDTTAPDEFNINQVFFNGSGDVSGLTLVSATLDGSTDVTAGWDPVQTGLSANGFGAFGFALIDGVGEGNPNVIGPGSSIVFELSIAGACAGSTSCDMNDFDVANGMGYLAAAKFVNGPDDPEATGMEDSAFGAVPEPGTALFLGAAWLAGAISRRRR